MGCCEGECSCGRGGRVSTGKGIHLVQITHSQEFISTLNWKEGLNSLSLEEEVVEVRFKNGRKAFFRSLGGLAVSKDDRVVVEADQGYDLGTVSLSREKARKVFGHQDIVKSGLSRVYRKSTVADLERWLDAKEKERGVLLEARKIASELGLELTVSDVEFRGDGKKATLYYSADEDFDVSYLVHRLTSAFAVEMEMTRQFTEVTASLNR